MGKKEDKNTEEKKKSTFSLPVFLGGLNIYGITLLSSALSQPLLPILLYLIIHLGIVFNAYMLMLNLQEIIERTLKKRSTLI